MPWLENKRKARDALAQQYELASMPHNFNRSQQLLPYDVMTATSVLAVQVLSLERPLRTKASLVG